MIWRYYIPHAWAPGERMTWADVLVMPADQAYTDKALTLTVNAVPDATADLQFDRNTIDLAVRATDFSKEECIAWVERCLAEDFNATGLVEGTLEHFAGRNNMADVIVAIRDGGRPGGK